MILHKLKLIIRTILINVGSVDIEWLLHIMLCLKKSSFIHIEDTVNDTLDALKAASICGTYMITLVNVTPVKPNFEILCPLFG
jgi:hypothetical protein